ncbi:MAG: molybdopterin-dependent oxidoreductase [Deltaproteobacteria bacterium]|nr:molybdopterin-dependent oxidoreductase [Deltaproteobacteria bacterium]
MKRRDFLKFIGAGGLGAAAGFIFGRTGKPPGAKLMPVLIPDDNITLGLANYYSSLCTQCGAGCGIQARVMDGRVKKIEGNPGHPVSKGKLCALGQAGVQSLYNPDRIKTPLKRRGERGTGDYVEISWDEALKAVTANLAEIEKQKKADKLFLLTSPQRGSLGGLMRGFMAGIGSANIHEYELSRYLNLQYANKVSMGLDGLPYYDIANTRYLLSFGADFSSTWASPVNMSYGYGQMRQGAHRGKLVQVEPRMSLTGANADEWVPARPGSEAILALAIAHAIVEKGWYKGADAGAWRSLLGRYSPKDVQEMTDVSTERIYSIAKEISSNKPSMVIGGDGLASYDNGISGHVAVNILNHLIGANGAIGGVLPNDHDSGKVDFKRGIAPFNQAALSGNASALIVHNANPAFTTPVAAKTGEALRKIPFIVSLTSFMDETSVYADIILPIHTGLEDWGDDTPSPGVGFPVRTIMQPVVTPVYDTKSAGDIFLSVAASLGGKTASSLKAGSFAQYVKDSWQGAYAKDRAMASSALTFEEFWNNLLKKGGWWTDQEPKKRSINVSAQAVSAYLPQGQAKFDGKDTDYPLYLVLYQQHGMRDGRGANLPWLQELADPTTTVVWGSWVDINPKTAASRGIKEGDLVTVESPYGKVTLPAYLYPAIRPDTVGMPIGQGHSAYGRFARSRGANPIEILPFKEDARSGAYALNSTRVRLSSNGKGNMVKIEGSTKELGRGIIRTVSSKG